MKAPTEGEVASMIDGAERLRSMLDPSRIPRSVVVSGRPADWATVAAELQGGGHDVRAFHDPLGEHGGSTFEGKPVVRRAEDGAFVVYAGTPHKRVFNACPPGPQRCAFHGAPKGWQLEGWVMPELWDRERARVMRLFAMLADAPSRATLASILRARVEGDTGYHRVSRFFEYQHPVVHAEPGDVVIDAGAYDGEIARSYATRVGKNGLVLAMEPDERNYAKLEAERSANIRPLKVGAWSGNDVLRFRTGRGASSKLDPECETMVPVTSIDDVVAAHRLRRVDLIKLDVEGAEEHAIRGAADTIRRNRPKMHVSIYHRPDDLLELPELLRPMLPRYRFYLGHHSFYQMETDLYAVPIEKWVRRRVRRYFGRA